MQVLLSLLLRVALQPIANLVTALLGPTLRSLQPYGLKAGDLAQVLALVGELYAGRTPVFPVMGQLSATEVQDVAEAVHELLKSLTTEYGIVLTADQSSKVLAAVSARIQTKFPA